MTRFILLLALLVWPCLAAAQAAPAALAAPAVKAAPVLAHPPVILISIDGFRADYITRGYTPTLLRLARGGAWATRGMRPSFPSLTFPNHYTLVTGLRPDHHGIVANTMDDPTITGDEHFAISDFKAVSDGRWWAQATPLWATAKAAGLRSATLFWPGSEAQIDGVRPARFTHFDDAFSEATRVDMLLDWLDLPPETRPTFLTLYFDKVDHEAHLNGVWSVAMNRALVRTDRAIDRLLRGLEARGLSKGANLVIVADHGMAETSADRVVFVDDWGVGQDAVKQTSGGSISSLTPVGPASAAAEAAILKPHDHVQCWRKADIPARLHYGTNPRIPPLICLAEPGWEVTTRAAAARITHFNVGEHGYDPATPQMAALFIGSGPAFKSRYEQPVFDNVDVQPLLLKLLGLAPTAGDGSLADIQGMLRR